MYCLAQPLAQAEGFRSGETCSLRRAPPSPRQGFDGAPREHHGISLRRDPSRLGEVFTRSKVQMGRLGDLSRNGVWASRRQTRLGESDSLGRDYQFSPWFLLQQMYIPIQTTIQGILRTKNNDFTVQHQANSRIDQKST